jgi:hypothetical protein
LGNVKRLAVRHLHDLLAANKPISDDERVAVSLSYGG